MADMAAGSDVHRENWVAQLQQPQERAGIGVRARVRLDISEAAPKDLARTSDRQILDCISKISTILVRNAN